MDTSNPHQPTPPARPELTDAPSLISDVYRHCKDLAVSEFRLAKIELKRNAKRLTGGIVLVVAAVAFALVGIGLLITAVVGALMALGWPLWLSALVAGVGCFALAGLFVWGGLTQLKPSKLMPRETIHNVKTDLKSLKEAANV